MQPRNFLSFGTKLSSANVLVFPTVTDLLHDKMGMEFDDSSKLIKGDYSGIKFPVIFKQHRKGAFSDILDTGWSRLYLISKKFKILLEDNGLIGWKLFLIKLFDLNGNEIDGYYGFSVTGHCGPTNCNQSEIIEKRMVSNGPLSQYYKGIAFDDWDGSDFFIPDKTNHIFITKKTAEILKKNKITNLKTECLSEREIPVSYVQKNT